MTRYHDPQLRPAGSPRGGTSAHAGAIAPGGEPAARRPRPRWLSRRPWFLPEGRHLSDEAWRGRHRGLTLLLCGQIPILFAYGLIRGYGLLGSGLECAALLLPSGLSSLPRVNRSVRSASTALGLVVAASIFVHFSGGMIEAHFEFFVVLAFLTLYQAWQPFLLALAYIVLEHGIVGVLDPRAVYDEASAIAHPWIFAGIHGGFILAASFANVLAWRLTEQEALTDGLTGVANRSRLLDWLTKALDSPRSRGCAVVLIDLDDFKDTNDGFGHEIGDLLLQTICRRLARIIRDGDLLTRVGGDEFAVGLFDLGNRAEGMATARRILEMFGQPFALPGLQLSVSASLGVAFGEDEHSSATELLRNADLAMYEAKREGGARVRQYEPAFHAVALRRTELIAELRGALADGQLVVHYQPIVDLRSRSVVGTEALVRWLHPTRGTISPGEFIPAAERSGLIVELGAWILRTACAQTAQWQSRWPDRPPLTVSVNLSPRQLVEPSMVATVVSALAEARLDPASLCLEITEGSLIRDFDASLAALQSIRTIGVSLALDDFGTGYSSLSYLQQLPAETVKIDRSFITDLDGDGPDAGIVRAIVELARALSIGVTAEGVETEKQLATLRAMRVDRVQGYLFGRPQLAEHLTVVFAESGTSCSWGSQLLDRGDCSDRGDDAESLAFRGGAGDAEVAP